MSSFSAWGLCPSKNLGPSLILLNLFSLISAIPTPLQILNISGGLSNFQTVNETPAITLPSPPPGFDIDLYYGDINVNPLGAYLGAINCMYRFAQLGWDQPFADGIRIWADGYTVEVDIESSQGPRTSLELKTSHILLTLYQSVLAMSANTFLEVLAIMSLQRREIGVLRIQRLQSVSSNQSSSAGSLRALPHITTSVAANPSGTVKDNDDPQFTISYAYSGTRINSQDIFIAVLDAIAITAEHDVTSPFERLIAISASKKCEIIISGVVAKFQINNSFVIKALRILIFDVFVPLKTFGGMTFQLKFEGEIFAEGKITAISPSNEGASAIEVAK